MRDVGVVIGRFQVPRLTSGHHAVLSAASKHAVLIVLIGNTDVVDDRNPLDFITRMRMVQDSYPHAIVANLNDVEGDDAAWSAVVDRSLKYLIGTDVDITFYGGRDSFKSAYSGKHTNFCMVHQVAQEAWSGSTDRAHVLAGFNVCNEDFRRGIIYGVGSRSK